MGSKISCFHTFSAYATNDFELAIRSSKELEHVLEKRFHATGNSLGEKASSARLPGGSGGALPRSLQTRIARIAREQTLLMRDMNHNRIDNRLQFIAEVDAVKSEFKAILEPGGARPKKK